MSKNGMGNADLSSKPSKPRSPKPGGSTKFNKPELKTGSNSRRKETAGGVMPLADNKQKSPRPQRPGGPKRVQDTTAYGLAGMTVAKN